MSDLTIAFELLKMLETTKQAWTAIEKEIFSPEQYLKKGEFIQSLLREKTKKMVIKNSVLSILSKKQMQSENAISYALKRIRTKIAVPAIQDASLTQTIQHLPKLYPGIPISLSEVPKNDRASQLMKEICGKDAAAIEIKYGDNTTSVTCLHPIKRKFQQKFVFFTKDGISSRHHIVDLSQEVAKWILISEIVKYLLRLESRHTGDVVESFLGLFVRQSISSCTREGVLKISNTVKNSHDFISWLEKNDISYSVESPLDTSNANLLNETDLAAFSLWNDHALKSSKFLQLPNLSGFLGETFLLVYSEYDKDNRTQLFFRNMETEYARVYETKKHIPYKTVEAMEQSGFNEFFGYVEFDSECDLEKIKKIELEFRALQTIFLQKKRKDVSLRFRKLGHYKASGLYFPFLKCLCVDVRTPSSMAHEYFHMIDYEYGNLSRKANFQPIYDQNILLLESAISEMKEDDERKIQWSGTSKYNKDYYLEPTEIFARCGEIFLTKILNVSNSLCQPCEGFEYPDDDNLKSKMDETR